MMQKIDIRKIELQLDMLRKPELDDQISQIVQEAIDCIMSKLIKLKVDPCITTTMNISDTFVYEDDTI